MSRDLKLAVSRSRPSVLYGANLLFICINILAAKFALCRCWLKKFGDLFMVVCYIYLYVMFHQVAPLIANFDPYVNNLWLSRRAVLTRFQQAARKVFTVFFQFISLLV